MSAEREGREAAERYRTQHHLGTQPLGDLITLIDLLEGIDVAVIRSPADEAHGLTIRDPATGTAMIIAVATPNATRLRSTIAHELGHYLFNDMAAGDPDRAAQKHEESRANAFARHLLLPLAAVSENLGTPDPEQGVSEADLSAVVQLFGISPHMAAIQFREARYISEAQKTEWADLRTPRLAKTHGWRPLYSLWQMKSKTIRPPQRLLRRSISGYTQGLVSVGTIARLEHTDAQTAEADLNEAGLIARPPSVERATKHDIAQPSPEAQAAFDADFGDDTDSGPDE